jgi:NADPH:quinone reductase-like Zn-dependent oxidoreductase
MKAVLTLGVGGYEQLSYQEVTRPQPGTGEVLLQVLASSVNSTDINTRLGWYAADEMRSTQELATQTNHDPPPTGAGGWSGHTRFPLIQGADCCGRVVQVGLGGNSALLGQRVLVRPCMRPHGFASPDSIWLGSDMNGAFAQFVKAPDSEVFPVKSHLSDAELGCLPCAYGTAYNMLLRARVHAGMHVVITGASGGVGVATLQLALLRGAWVTAITSREKMPGLRALGAHQVLDRDRSALADLGPMCADVVVDNVAGTGFGERLALLKRGGRLVSSGAIAGPLVQFDLRTLYLNDLAFLGCTAWDEAVFPALIDAIEREDFAPIVARTYALSEIVEAQREFLTKQHLGKFALVA